MNHIYLAIIIGLVLTNFTGLTLAVHGSLNSYALAKVASPILLCLLLFFLEHLHGFGNISWLWPLTTAISAFFIMRKVATLRHHWRIEAAFIASFVYALMWRYAFPDIDANSEKLTNLHFIGSFMGGATLPPVDTWLPPYKLDIYYTFQQYSASLMGRLFGLDVGTTFNIGLCSVIALTITASATAIAKFCPEPRLRYLVLAAFVVGGTGASLLIHFMMDKPPELWSSMRFIGEISDPNLINTPLGAWVREMAYPPNPTATHIASKLPSETFSYLAYLGDFHAPVSGFLLLSLALMCIALMDRDPKDPAALSVLISTVAISIAANTWLFPFQAILVGTWLYYQYITKRAPEWRIAISAGIISLLLILPHLKGFSIQSLDFKTSIKLVTPEESTPWLMGIFLHWPIIILIAFGLLPQGKQGLSTYFAIIWACLYIFSETCYIDDTYLGDYNRFNTTLKWWPWIQTGALLSLGALNLGHRNKIARYGTTLVLIVISSYAFDLGRTWLLTPKNHLARLDGAAWITDDNVQKAILDFLKSIEPGVVLERVPTGGFTYAPAMAMFSGHPSMLGWSGHESLWRGYRTDINVLQEQSNAFFEGKLVDSVTWLRQNKVRYIVWLKNDNIAPYEAYKKIHEQIRTNYDWKEFYAADWMKVGVWVRRDY